MGYPTMFEVLTKRQKQVVWTGIALTLIGMISLIFPATSLLSAQTYIGIVMVSAGLIGFYVSRTILDDFVVLGAKFWSLMNVLAGGFLIFNQVSGALYLTGLVGLSFALQALYEIFLGLELRGQPVWVWLLLSGIVSGGLSIAIFSGLHGGSDTILGLIVGANFISSGLALVVLQRHLKAYLR